MKSVLEREVSAKGKGGCRFSIRELFGSRVGAEKVEGESIREPIRELYAV
jgi:hypothetical protein